jgi:hypothetical protein
MVPDATALAEWAEPAVKIPCSRMLMNPEINTTGALVDHAPFVAALDALYRNKVARAELAARSVQHVRQDGFTWNSIARQFNAVLKTLRSKGARLTSARRARA